MSFKRTLFNLKRTLSLLLFTVILTPKLTALVPPIQVLASSSTDIYQNVNVSGVLGNDNKGKGNYLSFVSNEIAVNNTDLSKLCIEGAELFRVSLIQTNNNNNADTTESGKLVPIDTDAIKNNPIHIAPLGFKNYYSQKVNGKDLFSDDDISNLYTPQNYHTLGFDNNQNTIKHPSHFNTRRDYIALEKDDKVLQYNSTLQTTTNKDGIVTDNTTVYQGGGFTCKPLYNNIYEIPLIENVVSDNTPCLDESSNKDYKTNSGLNRRNFNSNADYFKAIAQAIYVDPDKMLNKDGISAQVMLYHILMNMTGIQNKEDLYDKDNTIIQSLVKKVQSREYEILIEPMLIFKCDDGEGKSTEITNVLENIFSNYHYIALTCGDMGFIDDVFSTVMYGFTSPDTYYYQSKDNTSGDGRGYNPMTHNPKAKNLIAKFHKSLMLTESHPEVGLYSIFDDAGQKYFQDMFDGLTEGATKVDNVSPGFMQSKKPGAWIAGFFYRQMKDVYNNSNDDYKPPLKTFGEGDNGYQVPDIYAFLNTGGLYILPMAYDTIDYTPTLVGKSNTTDPTTNKPKPSTTLEVKGQQIPVYKDSYNKETNTITFKASTAINKDNTVWTASVLDESTRNGTGDKKLNGINLPSEGEVSDITNAKTEGDGNYYIPANTVSRVTVTYTDNGGNPIKFKQVDGTEAQAGSSIISDFNNTESGELENQTLFITNSNMYGFDKDDNPISECMSVSQAKAVGDDNIELGNVIQDERENPDDDESALTGYIQMKLPSPEYIPADAKYVRIRYEVNTGGLVNSTHKKDGTADHEGKSKTRPVQYTDTKTNTVINNYALYSDTDAERNFKAISDCMEKGDFLKDNTVDILIPITQSTQLDFASKVISNGYVSVGSYTKNEGSEDEKTYEVGLIYTKATFSCEDDTDIPDEGIDIPFSLGHQLVSFENPSTFYTSDGDTDKSGLRKDTDGELVYLNNTSITSKVNTAEDTPTESDTNKYLFNTISKEESGKTYYYPSFRFYKKSTMDDLSNTDLSQATMQGEFKTNEANLNIKIGDVNYTGKLNDEANRLSSSFHGSTTNVAGNYININGGKSRLYLAYDKNKKQYAAMLITAVTSPETYSEKYVSSSSGINSMYYDLSLDTDYPVKDKESVYKSDPYTDNGTSMTNKYKKVTGSGEVGVYENSSGINFMGSTIKFSDKLGIYIDFTKLKSKPKDDNPLSYYFKYPEGNSNNEITSFTNILKYHYEDDSDTNKKLIKKGSTSLEGYISTDTELNESLINIPNLYGTKRSISFKDEIPDVYENNTYILLSPASSVNDWDTTITVPKLSTPSLESDNQIKYPTSGSSLEGDVIYYQNKSYAYYLYPLDKFTFTGNGQLYAPDNVLVDGKISHSLQVFDIENQKTVYNGYGYSSNEASVEVTTSHKDISYKAEVTTEICSWYDKTGSGTYTSTSYKSELKTPVEDISNQLKSTYGTVDNATLLAKDIKVVNNYNGKSYLAIPNDKCVDLAAIYSVNYKPNFSIDDNRGIPITESTSILSESNLESSDFYSKAGQPGSEEEYENNFAIEYLTLEGPLFITEEGPNSSNLSCTLPSTTGGVSLDNNKDITYKTAMPRASFTTSSTIPVGYIWGKPARNITSPYYKGVVQSYGTNRRCGDYRNINERGKTDNGEDLSNFYYVYQWIEYGNTNGYVIKSMKVPAYKRFRVSSHHTSGCKHPKSCSMCYHYEWRQLNVDFKRSYTMIYDNDYINNSVNSRAGSVEGKGTDKDYVVTAGKGIIATVRSKLITDFGATGNITDNTLKALGINDSKYVINSIGTDSGSDMKISPSFEFRYSIGSGADKFDESPFYSVYFKNNGDDNNTLSPTSSVTNNNSNIKNLNDSNIKSFLNKDISVSVTKDTSDKNGLISWIITNKIGGAGLYTNHNYPESDGSNGLTVQMITTLSGKNAITIGGKKQSLGNLTYACEEDEKQYSNEGEIQYTDNFILGQCWRYRLFVLSNMYNDVWARPTD